jgi:hypothetical protein
MYPFRGRVSNPKNASSRRNRFTQLVCNIDRRKRLKPLETPNRKAVRPREARLNRSFQADLLCPRSRFVLFCRSLLMEHPGVIMARRYHVEGTKAFLFCALILLALGLWCVKDGWFPAESTLLKHPLDQGGSFYLFNKSLAALSLLGATICGYIHMVVK